MANNIMSHFSAKPKTPKQAQNCGRIKPSNGQQHHESLLCQAQNSKTSTKMWQDLT